MSFTVETGAGVANANSYVSVSDANAFHTDRGNTTWTGSDAVKQSALVKATDYVTQNYCEEWAGERIDEDQALDWPRYGTKNAGYDEMVPERLKQAVCILALEALSNDLNPALARGGAVKREKVDVIETEYMDGASSRTIRPAVDGLLKPLLRTSPTGISGRAIRV